MTDGWHTRAIVLDRWPLGVALSVTGVLAATACSSAADEDDDGSAEETGDTGGEAQGPQWLAGDLHLHSSWSEDALDNPVDVVIEVAGARGMDYFVFTDHDNHVDGQVRTWDDPLYATGEMLLLFGIEYTTARGHANFFATAPWDHLQLWALREGQGDGQPIVDTAHDLGLHMSINHPVNDDPWEFSMDLDYDSMEIWNAVWTIPARNSEAVGLWDELLRAGRRLPGRGGSDVHHQMGFEAGLLNVGNPTTWIYAESRTPQAVLDGLAAGHATISYAPDAERLELRADADADGTFEGMMGDSVNPTGESLALEVEVLGFRNDADYELTLLRDGVPEQTIDLDTPRRSFELSVPADGRVYFRAELRGGVPLAPDGAGAVYGDMIAMTNPIYVRYD